MDDIIIVGAGIGGLTPGAALHAAGEPCPVFWSAAEIPPICLRLQLPPPAPPEPSALRRGRAAIACDGINSAIRKQFFPDEGEPRYSGVSMWRGVTRWKPMLSGASMVRAGWLSHGKMVIYPIRPAAGADGLQLINWVAEIETPVYRKRDWNRAGAIDDFIGAFADWHFDWLDVPSLIRAADTLLEFPMVDQDPLPRWSFGRGTLSGDAAHPMGPRGSNGPGQAILDARARAS